jgi:hypothetical protein
MSGTQVVGRQCRHDISLSGKCLSPTVDEMSVVVAAFHDPKSDVLPRSDRVRDEIANPLIATYGVSERCGSTFGPPFAPDPRSSPYSH